MPRKKEALTLSVPPGTKEKLDTLAAKLKILWGKKPSPSGLIVAIADQKLEVAQPFSLTKMQVQALEQALKALTDTGHIQHAQTLAALALERGNLNPEEQQAFMQQVSQSNEAWRIIIDDHLNKQQPFHILYRNGQGQNFTYTVRCGEICFEEKRYYLQAWCDETHDIKYTDIPELIHNRCLRFDHIQSILPATGPWREQGLDHIKVYLHFLGGLAHAYEQKPNDISNIMNGNIRQVVRRVTNHFWLFRDVRRYGENCLIISPENIRQAFKKELLKTCQKYDININE